MSNQHSEDAKSVQSFIETLSKEMAKPEMYKQLDDAMTMIRPSGNPLNKKQWIEMCESEDLKVTHSKLISINKLEVGKVMSYACWIQHDRFEYKGVKNDDVSVFSAVLKKDAGLGW
eukprot:52044_1